MADDISRGLFERKADNIDFPGDRIISRYRSGLTPLLTQTEIETYAMVTSDEWEWRKNYRVWEANRKVFLYPENYLEPDLRDNKTPIFKELEDELLQEKITKDSAEAAYRKYLAQFAELAHLKIAGSYYHNEAWNINILFLCTYPARPTTILLP